MIICLVYIQDTSSAVHRSGTWRDWGLGVAKEQSLGPGQGKNREVLYRMEYGVVSWGQYSVLRSSQWQIKNKVREN
jgi:hypothetical protein